MKAKCNDLWVATGETGVGKKIGSRVVQFFKQFYTLPLALFTLSATG
jgi:hypothetical protein